MLEKISQLFKIKPKSFLGVDIGASSIRVVELDRKGDVFKLSNYGEMTLADLNDKPFRKIKENTVQLSNEEIAKNLKTIIEKTGIKTKEACFSIPDFSSFFTNIDLPVMDKEEVEEAVKYQVRPYIPLSLDEVALDWLITEGTPSKTELKVLVVAIPNEIINRYREIAELAGLDLKFLEPEVFSLARSTIKNNENIVSGLLDIGTISTNCSLAEGKVVQVSHSFNIAGTELTDVIARSLNISYNEAEKLKRKEGLLPDGKTRKILLPLVGSILDETKKAFRSFYVQHGKSIEKVILAGGVALTPGLKEFFAVEIKKPIIIADPFLGIAAPAILADVLKQEGPNYGVAVGLALKGFE